MRSSMGPKARVRNFFRVVKENVDRPQVIKSELKKLVLDDLDLNVQGYNGYTLLHIVVRFDDKDLIKIFHDAKVNLEISSQKSETPLHYAIVKNKFQSFKALIEYGADLNSCADYELSPMHYAVNYNRLEMLKYLIDKKAIVDIQDENNDTPLFFAVQQEQIDMVKLLLNAGANIFNENVDGISVLDLIDDLKSQELRDLLKNNCMGSCDLDAK